MKHEVSKQSEITDEGSIGLSAGFKKYSEEREISHDGKLNNFLEIYKQGSRENSKDFDCCLNCGRELKFGGFYCSISCERELNG